MVRDQLSELKLWQFLKVGGLVNSASMRQTRNRLFAQLKTSECQFGQETKKRIK